MKKVEIRKFENGYSVVGDELEKVYFDFWSALSDIRFCLGVESQEGMIQAPTFSNEELDDFDDMQPYYQDEKFNEQLEKTVQSMFTRIGEEGSDDV